MNNTTIEWVSGGKSWNPITGCTPCSVGCQKCYAKRMANRLRGRYGYPKDEPFRVTFHENRLDEVNPKQKPSRIFVCSMGDIFHADVTDAMFNRVWDRIDACRQHRFFVLTKRPERAARVAAWPTNVALGVTVCNQDEVWKINALCEINAGMRFVSYEPALGPLDIADILRGCPRQVRRREYVTSDMATDAGDQTLSGSLICDEEWEQTCPSPDLMIAGCETGAGARPARTDWFRDLRDQCEGAGIPFFLKKLTPDGNRLLDGREWNDFPAGWGQAMEAKRGTV